MAKLIFTLFGCLLLGWVPAIHAQVAAENDGKAPEAEEVVPVPLDKNAEDKNAEDKNPEAPAKEQAAPKAKAADQNQPGPEAGPRKPADKEAPKEAPKAGAKADPRAKARAEAREAAEADRLMVEAKSLEELPAMLGHARFRVRELAQNRLLTGLETDPEKVANLCFDAFTQVTDPEIRMRARGVLLEHVSRSNGGGVRGFVGIALLLHAFFDKGGEVQFAVKVSLVIPDTPAQKADIKIGDLITGIDDIKLDDKGADQRFMDIVAGKGAGKKVTLKLMRGEEAKEVEIVLAPRPEFLDDGRPPVDREKLLRDWLEEKKNPPLP